MNTLDKALRILTLLGESRCELSAADIARSLALPRSTAYRHILALKSQGLVEEDPGTGRLRLGARLLQLAGGVRRQGLVEVALPQMERLVAETGETVILAGLHGTSGICLERVEGHHALRVSHERGAIFPLHAGATGKVLLAAPILTGADRIVAALGASAPSTRLDAKSKGPFLKELSATARAIARELVGQDAN